MRAAGVLTRLSLAWSRDDTQKFYVQDRMREVGRDLWAWLADGAHVYVCGDAKHMAKDVERARVDVPEDPAEALGDLRHDGKVPRAGERPYPWWTSASMMCPLVSRMKRPPTTRVTRHIPIG